MPSARTKAPPIAGLRTAIYRLNTYQPGANYCPTVPTSYQVGTNGAPIPRDIITLFTCSYNGEEIFRAELSPAIAANPFLSFFTTARDSGTLVFHWSGDNGFAATETAELTVE